MPETYWKSFTSFVQVDILQREDVSHTAGIYTSLCKTLKLGYAIKTFMDCDVWTETVLFSSCLFPFLLFHFIQSFHQRNWIPEWVPWTIWHFEVQPSGLLRSHDQVRSAHCGGDWPWPPALLLHSARGCRLWAFCHHHYQARVPCQTAQEAPSSRHWWAIFFFSIIVMLMIQLLQS